jgi:hypothetical protein
MASAPMITTDKSSELQWNQCTFLEYAKAREQIPPVLASSLRGKYPKQWVPVLDLFEESAVHGVRMSLE